MKRTAIHIASALITLTVLSSCAAINKPPVMLRYNQNPPADGQSYSVIFYGNNYADDITNLVVMDRESDSVEIRPFTPEYEYEISGGLSAPQALSAAKAFLSRRHGYWNTEITEILAPDGSAAGYEVRPLYHVYIIGKQNVLTVNYWAENPQLIRFGITLDPQVERMQNRQTSDR